MTAHTTRGSFVSHKTFITVRFGETDALGHVNNVSYFIYFEQARVEFFKALGYGVGQKGLNFVLVSTHCDFLSQAYFDQELTIDTSVTKIGNKSFHLEHIITHNKTCERIAAGYSVVAILNEDKNKAMPISSELREKLAEYESVSETEVNH